VITAVLNSTQIINIQQPRLTDVSKCCHLPTVETNKYSLKNRFCVDKLQQLKHNGNYLATSQRSDGLQLAVTSHRWRHRTMTR